MFYTDAAVKTAQTKINKMGAADALAWALDTIAASVANVNSRAVAYAVYDLVTDKPEPLAA
ncbi:MAG: hypothetical protein ACKO0Z_06900 [Betaproteobacteria bacterium]